ncbi:DUF2147 domain-containing protein [Candidatus Haliotispira prima]|uniref:DUF2147 domain-containing protein n=1 Tax=Candidatus Haliotispira prima TaxID=3034016 RepID=A0ABY8MDT9_9SPIO|nr:DUF2147 domain-containing protein [Candidatus Haliotispira prima]
MNTILVRPFTVLFLCFLCLQCFTPLWLSADDHGHDEGEAQQAEVNNKNTIVGKWKTIDDTSGKAKALIDVYEQDGKIYGRIVRLFPDAGDEKDPVCRKCTDERKDQKIIGMLILKDLEQRNNDWFHGNILDPENGKVYRCKIRLEQDQLKVRGYVLIFSRTQTWYRAEESLPGKD